MIVQLNISDVILRPELNAAQITITPTFSSGIPDVNKQYVDEKLLLKVDKVAGKGLSTEDYTTAEKIKVANVPLNTNTELAAKVDKVEGKSLVDDTEIDKLAEYPEFEDLEFSHESLTDKNSESEFQHVDSATELGEAINEATHSLVVWNGTKALKVLFSRVVTFFESYFFKFGGQNFGAKKTIGSNDNQDFAVKTNNIERAVFTKEGRIGLNVTAPSELMEMNGNLYLNNTDPFIYGYLKRTYIDLYDINGGITIKPLDTSCNLKVLGGLVLAGGLSFVGDLLLSAGSVIKSGGVPNSIQLYNGANAQMIFKGGLANDSHFNFINAANTSLLFINQNGNIGIGNISPKSKLQVAGAIQIADDTAVASADKEGAIRYRKAANNSYIEMCMQTGATTYSWVIIKQNTW